METSHEGQPGSALDGSGLESVQGCQGRPGAKGGTDTDKFKVWQKCATLLWGCACGCDGCCEWVTVGMCLCGENVRMTEYVCEGWWVSMTVGL